MYRVLRSVGIGGGAAAAVGGVLYFAQQQKLANNPQPVHLCSEWGFETRTQVLRASVLHNAEEQAQCFERALTSIVTPSTDLRAKSAEWLTSYGDLLRSLALARSESRTTKAESDLETILEPLKAAATVPFGNKGLRAAAAALAYDLSGDPAYLSSTDLALPKELNSSSELKYWAPFALARAKLDISHSDLRQALVKLLEFHRASASVADDPLCFRPSTSGYIAQLLWRLGRPEDARHWLLEGEREATKCRTPACRETTAVLRDLMAKASR